MILTLLKWLGISYACALAFLTLCAWAFAIIFTRNVGFGAKWALTVAVDLTFQLLSRAIFNVFAAIATGPDWNIRWRWAKRLWQTPDSPMDGSTGDHGFYERWSAWYNVRPRRWRRFVVAWMWAQRNCAHGFSCYVTGLNRDKISRLDTIWRDSENHFLMAYSESGKLIGFEYKVRGFFRGNGDMRIGYKINANERQTWYPAQLVYRVNPWKKV